MIQGHFLKAIVTVANQNKSEDGTGYYNSWRSKKRAYRKEYDNMVASEPTLQVREVNDQAKKNASSKWEKGIPYKERGDK